MFLTLERSLLSRWLITGRRALHRVCQQDENPRSTAWIATLSAGSKRTRHSVQRPLSRGVNTTRLRNGAPPASFGDALVAPSIILSHYWALTGRTLRSCNRRLWHFPSQWVFGSRLLWHCLHGRLMLRLILK